MANITTEQIIYVVGQDNYNKLAGRISEFDALVAQELSFTINKNSVASFDALIDSLFSKINKQSENAAKSLQADTPEIYSSPSRAILTAGFKHKVSRETIRDSLIMGAVANTYNKYLGKLRSEQQHTADRTTTFESIESAVAKSLEEMDIAIINNPNPESISDRHTGTPYIFSNDLLKDQTGLETKLIIDMALETCTPEEKSDLPLEDTPEYDIAVRELGIKNLGRTLNMPGASSEQIFGVLNSFRAAYISYVMTQLTNGMTITQDKSNQLMALPVAANRQADIVTGLAGAGKSTTISNIMQSSHSFWIDADRIKMDFAKHMGISVNTVGVHQLSGYFRDALTEVCAQQGINIIIEKIGDKKKSIDKTAKSLEGYSVGLQLVHITNDRSVQNDASRARGFLTKSLATLESDGVEQAKDVRLVGCESIANCNQPLETFLAVKRDFDNAVECYFSRFSASSNEVPYEGKKSLPPIPLTEFFHDVPVPDYGDQIISAQNQGKVFSTIMHSIKEFTRDFEEQKRLFKICIDTIFDPYNITNDSSKICNYRTMVQNPELAPMYIQKVIEKMDIKINNNLTNPTTDGM